MLLFNLFCIKKIIGYIPQPNFFNICGRLAQFFGGFSARRIFSGGFLAGHYLADFWRILDKSYDIYSQAADLLDSPTWQLQPKLTIAVASCDNCAVLLSVLSNDICCC